MLKKMIKIMMLLSIIVMTISSCATFAQVSGPVRYVRVLSFEGISKDDIYSRVRLWISEVQRHAPLEIDYSDRNAGVIRGHMTVTTNPRTIKQVRSLTTIEIQEERLRISFTNPIVRSQNNPNARPITMQYDADEVQKAWTSLVNHLNGSVRRRANW